VPNAPRTVTGDERIRVAHDLRDGLK
jgi:hypothetical protein